MLIKTYMWQPGSEARQYEATGSRTSFSAKWNPHIAHSFYQQEPVSDIFQLFLNVLIKEQKTQASDKMPLVANSQRMGWE